jgi:hypothetical protein
VEDGAQLRRQLVEVHLGTGYPAQPALACESGSQLSGGDLNT